MHVGVPVAPVSPAYSLLSKDFAKLKYIFELLRPGLVFAAEAQKFAPRARGRRREIHAGRRAARDQPGLDASNASIRSRSGPTRSPRSCSPRARPGMPKGVINTQRMLCANQQALAQAWPFLERPAAGAGRLAAVEPHLRRQPQLQHGAAQRRHALHRRRQAGAGADRKTTVRNLREVAPTLYFNVPRGFDMLLPFLESDAALRRKLLPRAARCSSMPRAALPQNLWDRLERAGREASAAAASRHALGLGLDRDRAARDPVHFRMRARRRDRPAGRRACELKLVPVRRQARGARARRRT